jgi:NitT/TauT family transport system ATP-binding protein
MGRQVAHARIENAEVSFLDSMGKRKAVLRDCSLSIGHDEIVTILGPNGSGKSTLLNAIAGFKELDKGNISITNTHGNEPKIGYVWQDYREALLPWFNVEENISFPLRIKGYRRKERIKLATKLLEHFGKGIDGKRHTYELSGGQQQLVGILRTLSINPDIILLDEPFSALDIQARWNIAKQFEKIWINNKIPTLFISHDIDEAISIADRVALLSKKTQNIVTILKNTNPRPRTPEMINSAVHISCKKAVIEFFHKEGVL